MLQSPSTEACEYHAKASFCYNTVQHSCMLMLTSIYWQAINYIEVLRHSYVITRSVLFITQPSKQYF